MQHMHMHIHTCHAGTYIPRKEVVVEETVRATIIKPNQAIKLRARKETLVGITTLNCGCIGIVYPY